VQIGAKVAHGRYLIFQMAEVAVPIAIPARPRSVGFPDEDQATTERRSLAGRARPALHTGTKRASARASGNLPVNTLLRLLGRHDAAASGESMQGSGVVEVGCGENRLRG
jgi:hypothetical protein